MTVFFCREDKKTLQILEFFASQKVDGVTWNWKELPRQSLFRRSIGRNQAALETQADWVWFTDCDLLFHEKCLDTLARLLQSRNDVIVFPMEEQCSELLAEDSPVLRAGADQPRILEIDPAIFTSHFPRKATGPLQITHGDVCRAVGYCRSIKLYQEPSEAWCKAHEDRAFRWLIQSPGKPLPVPGVYRVRHLSKGRYSGNKANTRLRTFLLRTQARISGY